MADVLDDKVISPLNLLLKKSCLRNMAVAVALVEADVAKSKDIVRNLIQEGFLHRSSEVPHGIIKTASASLSVEINEAEELINSIIALIQTTLYHGLTDPKDIYSVFPDDFHKNLRELLSKLLAEHMSAWRASAISEQVSLPRLLDFDWRVDVKTSSDAITRMSIPTCIMQLKIQENAVQKDAMPTVRHMNVELTKEKLDTMLDGLGKIRDQLSSIAK